MTHRRIYVASSWRNPFQQDIVRYLRELRHEVYDFQHPRSGGPVTDSTPEKGFAWSDIDPNWLNWEPRRYRDLIQEHPTAARGFEADFRAMQWADTCVLVLPCGRSAHLEAGWFVGFPEKRLHILLSDQGFEPELMYLMADGIHVEMTELAEALAANSATPLVAGGVLDA
jgi:hypothetical protein